MTKYILFLALAMMTSPLKAGPLSQCQAILDTLENNFLLKNDQRGEIAKLIAEKSPADIDAVIALLQKLPPRGLSADVLDFFRRSSPAEVMFVLRRLVTEDVDQFFLQRGPWRNMSPRDKVFFDVVANAKWRSFLNANFQLAIANIGERIKVSNFFQMLFKNKDRQVRSTYLEQYLLDLAGNYKQFLNFAEISLHFDTLANMQAEIRSRVRELRDLERNATGLKRIHLRKDRVTLETYLRLTESQSARWQAEGSELLKQQWDATRYRFLTGLFPKSPFLTNIDRAQYMVSSLGLGLLLYFLSDQSMEWLHQPTDVIFDEELGFDKEETTKDLKEDEKQYIREQLEAGRSLEDIFSELKNRK